MRRPPPVPGRCVSGLLAVVLAAAVAVLGAAPPAAAHGTLAMSTPATGATVAEPLATVQLYFTERVADNAYFAVTAPDGGRVDDGWTHGSPAPLDKPVREYLLVDGKFEPREYATGFPAVVKLAHLPAAGQYTVSYLSVASDGEPVRGTMSFRYTGRVTAAPQGWRPPTTGPDPSLVAAAEQHETSGHGSPRSAGASAAPAASPAAPGAAASPAAAPADAGDAGGLGWLGWLGVVVAVAAVAGVVGWRHRAARAGGPAARWPWTRRPAAGRAVRRASAARAAGRAKSPGPKPRPATRGGGPRRGPAGPGEAPEPAPSGGPRLGDRGLAVVVGGLVVALLAGFGLGRVGAGDGRAATAAVGGSPVAGSPVAAGDGHQHAAGAGAHTHPGDGDPAQAQVTGTTVSAGGYTLKPVTRSQPAGVNADYRFRIVGADGRPETRFAVVHDKPLHLVVVGRDLGGYQHLHPTMAADGTWSVPLTLKRAGGYRVYADFATTAADGTARPLVLGVDHQVPGAHTPATLPAAQPRATAGPFEVEMVGTPTIGATVPLSFRVGRAGAPARLERYLGAYGHLVVVREGDLGYVHVHPDQELVDGAPRFWLTAPGPSRYRAYFDFQVDGKVHTAEFTLDLG
ncbi:copper resistance CopC family protein [Micromonospora haikouensis]|uniref:copper resistance CopC family protein n=1 Tax=Micromonospora haikouensis TaxID=686309 RepID=UPI003D7039E6